MMKTRNRRIFPFKKIIVDGLNKGIGKNGMGFVVGEDGIAGKIKKAFCAEGDVENNPCLEIVKSLNVFSESKTILEVKRQEANGGDKEYSDFEELKKDFAEKNLHPGDLKNAVKNLVVAALKPIAENKTPEFKNNMKIIDQFEKKKK